MDETGAQLGLNTAVLKELLQYHYDLVYRWKITPATMAKIPWGTILKSFVDGVMTFWQGGTWHRAEWRTNYGLSEEAWTSNMSFFPIPPAQRGGQPNGISHPMVYMISSRSKHPALAFRLLVHASAAELNAQHALHSGHLAIRARNRRQPRASTSQPIAPCAPRYRCRMASGRWPYHRRTRRCGRAPPVGWPCRSTGCGSIP